MKRFASVILCLFIIFSFIPKIEAKAISTPASKVKIGLSYGDNGVPAAKLQNASGYTYGYTFGFFNTSNVFCALLKTTEREIAVIKNKNIWITSNDDYYDVKPSSHKYYIGCYHLQLNQTFQNTAEATADYILKVMIDANKEKVDRAIEKATAEAEQKENEEKYSA